MLYRLSYPVGGWGEVLMVATRPVEVAAWGHAAGSGRVGETATYRVGWAGSNLVGPRRGLMYRGAGLPGWCIG